MDSEDDRYKVSIYGGYIDSSTDRVIIQVEAGREKVERIVPPAGESFAFDYVHWNRRVQISISPTGKSVRVFVDGVEIPKQKKGK